MVIGTILIDVLKSSAVGSLIEVLGAYFKRDKTVAGKITFPDGTVVEIDAKNLRDAEFEATLRALAARAADG